MAARYIAIKGMHCSSKKNFLKTKNLRIIHSSPTTGHYGFHKTYEQTKHSFFWEGMKNDIQDFVATCDTYQQNKGERVKMPGALQLLPIPTHIWVENAMDFIVEFRGQATNPDHGGSQPSL
jgi:hypothetical protein